MNPKASALLDALGHRSASQPDPWLRLAIMLEKNAGSDFGRAFGFDRIRSPQDFMNSIPVMDYEAYRSWVQRAAKNGDVVLACGRILGFEKTSGTTSASKWIPISEGLREEFAQGLAAWFGGWKRRCPEVFSGSAYWSISPPAVTHETTCSGLPVGMTSDAAYFPEEIGERLVDWLVIPELSGTAGAVFDETAEALLASPDLSLISVWSPTFLLGIDASLRKLQRGFDWRSSFPNLALVSCWADAASRPWIPRLEQCLGGIPIEGKGLLATEGITSLPDEINGSPRLASECHWHEFLDGAGRNILREDLRIGEVYEVLLTTAGGLYRYRTGDRVSVTGIGPDGFPRLRFIGRLGDVSDLVGEKLHESQLIAALGGKGFMVADPDVPSYGMWIENPDDAKGVEHLLRQNPYFDQALALGQLAPIRVYRLAPDWSARLSMALAKRRGGRLGDVKPVHLLTGVSIEEVESWLE